MTTVAALATTGEADAGSGGAPWRPVVLREQLDEVPEGEPGDRMKLLTKPH